MSAADSGSGRPRLERIHLHGWDDSGGCRQTLSAPTTAASTGSVSPAARRYGNTKPRPTAASSASDHAKRQQLTASPQREIGRASCRERVENSAGEVRLT